MTLNLTADAEARVRSVAEMRGQDPEDALLALLDQALAEAEAEEELVAELRASVEDHAAGRSMTIDEYRAKTLARRQERDKQRAMSSAVAEQAA